jgi:hypothetical protein
MRLKLFPSLIPAFLLAFAVFPAHSQVQPAATEGGLPVVAGLGGADFSLDWGPGHRMEGITAWVDIYPWGLPPKIHGLGVEAEGRDINFNRPTGLPKMRQDTGLVGPIYSFPEFKNFHPYGKYLLGIGSIDFPANPTFPYYTHDTFLVLAPGGGLDYHIKNHIWVRGDYEYQFWHHTWGYHDLNPNGVSFGVSWDFRPAPTSK